MAFVFYRQGKKFHYRPGTSDEDVIKHSFDNDIFLTGIPEYRLKRDHVVFDIGAHIGTFAVMVAENIPEGKVYAFEPCSDTFNYLHKNKEENNLANLEIFKLAIADKKGEVELYHDLEHGNWGHSIVKPISGTSELVSTDTLADVFTKSRIEKCNLIKFNCEGAEFSIILNTPIEVLRNIDNMIILYHEDMVEGLRAGLLEAHLREAGFRIVYRNVTIAPPRGWIIAYRASFLKNMMIKANNYFHLQILPWVRTKLSRTKTAVKKLLPG